jgi:hypothetical protein
MQNRTIEDRTVRTANRSADRTAEVAVCGGSAINAECRMNLRTVYPMDQEY